MRPLYPVHLNLRARRVLIVGGGKVARRKADTLLECGAKVTVVAPQIESQISDRPGLHLVRGPYRTDLLAGHVLVFACTDDRAVNRRVADDARRAGIWCNLADDPEGSDFHVPAGFRRGRVSLSVSTAGASPKLAAYLRDRCAGALPANVEELADILAAARAGVIERVADEQLRRKLLQVLADKESIDIFTGSGREAWNRWFQELVQEALGRPA